MILENNEEKRSTLWRTIVAISSILIVIVAVFFVTRLFVGNPLVGTWVSEDSGEVIKIESNGKVTLTDEDKKSFETVQSEVDTKTKVFTIHTEDTQAEGLLSGTYDYSIEKDTLPLTDPLSLLFALPKQSYRAVPGRLHFPLHSGYLPVQTY